MWRLPTTKVDIYRGTTTSVDGDEVDVTGVATYLNIPASIIEQSRAVGRRDSDLPRIVREVTGGMPHGTDVRVGDRLRDQASGIFYVVDAARQPARPRSLPPADIVLDLRRVSN